MHESEGQNGQMALKKSPGSCVNQLPSCFNVETKQNALMRLIFIVKTPGSRGLLVNTLLLKRGIVRYPFVKLSKKKIIQDNKCNQLIYNSLLIVLYMYVIK